MMQRSREQQMSIQYTLYPGSNCATHHTQLMCLLSSKCTASVVNCLNTTAGKVNAVQ